LDANKIEALKKLIEKNGIVFRKVILSSGKKSDYYYDLRKMCLDPKAIHLIADLLLEKIILKYGKIKSVGGLANGAIPLITAIVLKSSSNGGDIAGFFVRKERKPHGLQKIIEGKILEPVVILDDVITTGRSVRLAIDAVREEGYSVKGVATVIDREENNKQKHASKPTSLFRHSDFKQFIAEQIKRKKRTKIRA